MKAQNQLKVTSPKLEKDSRNELRRRNLFFSLQRTLQTRCPGKGKAYLIEVIFDADNNGDSEHDEKVQGTLASLSNGSRNHLFILQGILEGQ